MINNIKIHIGYSLLFLFLFFTGLDSLLIWKRTFLENKTYEYLDYFHYFLSIAGGWLLGILIFKKMIVKYPLDFMLKSSLLIAALAAWSQFRVISQGNIDLFAFNVFLNLIFNIAMGFLIYTLKSLLDSQIELQQALKTTLFLLFSTLTVVILSIIFVKTNIQYYFLITSFIYLLGHYFFRFFSIKDFLNTCDKNKYNPYLGISLGFIFICICIFLVKENYLNLLDTFVDKASFLLVFMFVYLTFKPTIAKSLLFCFLTGLFILTSFFN